MSNPTIFSRFEKSEESEKGGEEVHFSSCRLLQIPKVVVYKSFHCSRAQLYTRVSTAHVLSSLLECPLHRCLQESPLLSCLQECPLLSCLPESPLLSCLQECPLLSYLQESPLLSCLQESPLLSTGVSNAHSQFPVAN